MARRSSLFVSHGAPTFALEPGLAGPRRQALGRQLLRPEESVTAAGRGLPTRRWFSNCCS